MNRRTFLKIAGMGSINFTAGCSSHPEKHLYTLVDAPDDMVTGKAAWYAGTCRECPAGCGIIAKNREGRIVKLEGNPNHPINQGRLCMRGQAALQGLYDPDRLRQPLLKENGAFRPISFREAEALLFRKISAAAAKGPERIRIVTEVTGKTLNELLIRCLKKWNSGPPLIYEPYAYEALKSAHEAAFGLARLPSYAVERTDLLIGFGADFLETWLSPVEYARKFKQMHAFEGGRKGRFYHISPYQSLTGANADRSIMCRPQTESAVAFGMINAAVAAGRGKELPNDLLKILGEISSQYTAQKVVEISAMTLEDFSFLSQKLLRAERPLVLGLSAASAGPNAFETETAVLLLNLLLDPHLSRYDFSNSHRVETAAKRSEVIGFFKAAAEEMVDLLFLYNTNPVYSLPPNTFEERGGPGGKETFVVSFAANMDETALTADLVFPVATPLESWDEYGGKQGVTSMLQPAMGRLFKSPDMGELFLKLAFPEQSEMGGYTGYLARRLLGEHQNEEQRWLRLVQAGGIFNSSPKEKKTAPPKLEKAFSEKIQKILTTPGAAPESGLTFMAAPSIRFFDGRGANKAWLAEIPETTTQVAWQSVALMHPATLSQKKFRPGSMATLTTEHGRLTAAVYPDHGVHPQAVVIPAGQGHSAYGRFARNQGVCPLKLLPGETARPAGNPIFTVPLNSIAATGSRSDIAHTDGNPYDHGRKIALSVGLEELAKRSETKPGLTMHDFPMTLPLPEGYDPKRDIYPPHDHDTYRWGMVVDLDRCIGCGACAAACYAENNIGVVGEEQIVNGREMSWIRIERYRDSEHPARMIFLPMMCQHCDNAPCESVCPVYAPHHGKEGLNNQIYNRCIGTRFCAQNCPYKVRRFNWFTWQWPDPLPMQLNPNVTVRSKGVMEKCSFCIQRIKEVHGRAKNEKRLIKDGEVIPACVQTCPTGALTFGSLMDPESRVRRLTRNRRAYQVMGYLNTKPAVIYLKKVVETDKASSRGDKEIHV